MNTLKAVGLVFILVGLLIFVIGKKFFLLRAYFGDRSMFSQIGWGALFIAIGLILLYLSGDFTF